MKTLLRSPRFASAASQLAVSDPPVAVAESARPSRRALATSFVAPISRLLVHEGDRLVVVRLADTNWLEGAGKFVRIHIGAQAYLYRRTLSGLALRLDPRQFVRVHRSAIVNLDSIATIEPLEAGAFHVQLRDGSCHQVARRHRREFLLRVSES